MIKIKDAFEKGNALIPFVTGGDPDSETTKELLIAIEEAGADLIEIGLPFSDPVAEGVIIQDANERALKNGCTIDRFFAMIREARETVRVPLVVYTYVNPVFTYGKDAFMKQCVESKVQGIVLPDLPLEERGEVSGVCKEYGIELLSAVVPAPEARIAAITAKAEGFIHVVPCAEDADTEEIVKLVKKNTEVPCVLPFNEEDEELAKTPAAAADGIYLDTAIVRMIAEQGKEAVNTVRGYIKKLKDTVNNS